MSSTDQTDAPTGSREPFAPAAPYELVIGGEAVAAPDGFDAIDPSSGLAWATIPQAGAAEVDAAVAAARAASKEWGRTSAEVRQAMLWALADAVESEPERWARLLATENGRPIREALLADVPTCAGILRFFSGVTRSHHGQQIPVERADSLIYTTREPLGVIAALIPWNSPIITLANKIGPALAAGNTVVVKPSEFASASVLEFVRMAQEILPPGRAERRHRLRPRGRRGAGRPPRRRQDHLHRRHRDGAGDHVGGRARR